LERQAREEGHAVTGWPVVDRYIEARRRLHDFQLRYMDDAVRHKKEIAKLYQLEDNFDRAADAINALDLDDRQFAWQAVWEALGIT
jgi:hypothetical protein